MIATRQISEKQFPTACYMVRAGRQRFARHPLYQLNKAGCWGCVVVYRGLVCEICGESFLGNSANQIYCSAECREVAHPNFRIQRRSQRVCVHCNATFYTSHRTKKLCSSVCVEGYRQEKIRLRRIESVQSFVAGKVEAMHEWHKILFCNEEEFSYWFGKSYWLFGLKRLLKHDRYFPDVIALDADDRVLRIELEYDSANYRAHKHPATADLIISMIGSDAKVMGIPVISLLRKENGKISFGNTVADISSFMAREIRSKVPEQTYYDSINLTYPIADVIRQQETA